MTWPLKSLKNFHCNGILFSKVYIVWATKVQESYILWHWRVTQISKKNLFLACKMTWKMWQIFTRALESVKIGTLMDPFVQSRKGVTFSTCEKVWNFTEELNVMKMNNNTKIEQELTCRFKIDMRNFTNFDPSTRKSKKFVF